MKKALRRTSAKIKRGGRKRRTQEDENKHQTGNKMKVKRVRKERKT